MQHSGKGWLSVVKSCLRAAGIQMSRISPYTDDLAALGAMLRGANVDLILDVGANVGQYAKACFANGYEGRIVSFEPLSQPREALLKEAADYANWDVAEHCALGAEEGVITIGVAEDSEASSILCPSAEHLKYSDRARRTLGEVVRIERLDCIAKQQIADSKSPFLKVDVQGFEDQVLLGAKNIIPDLSGLQIELSLLPLYDGQKLFPEMLAMINSMGFTLHRLIPAWIDRKTGRWLQVDGIFFRID